MGNEWLNGQPGSPQRDEIVTLFNRLAFQRSAGQRDRQEAGHTGRWIGTITRWTTRSTYVVGLAKNHLANGFICSDVTITRSVAQCFETTHRSSTIG
jgi:hypothetical protein